MAYCIPNLEFDLLAAGLDDFGPELHSDGGVVVELELLFQELQQDARLAHA